MSGPDDLVSAALAARGRAYAPYSRFQVGAALRTEDGAVFAGCNVENAAFPEGTCAEAGAIAAMVMGDGSRRIAEVVVAAEAKEPCTPCGGCRQKLAEFAGPETPVTLATTDGALFRTTIGDLLPGAFGAADMPAAPEA